MSTWREFLGLFQWCLEENISSSVILSSSLFLPNPRSPFTNIPLHFIILENLLFFFLYCVGQLISGHPLFSLPLTLFAPALWKYLPSLKCSTVSESAWVLSPGIILPNWFPLLTRGMALGSILCPLRYLEPWVPSQHSIALNK